MSPDVPQPAHGRRGWSALAAAATCAILAAAATAALWQSVAPQPDARSPKTPISPSASSAPTASVFEASQIAQSAIADVVGRLWDVAPQATYTAGSQTLSKDSCDWDHPERPDYYIAAIAHFGLPQPGQVPATLKALAVWLSDSGYTVIHTSYRSDGGQITAELADLIQVTISGDSVNRGLVIILTTRCWVTLDRHYPDQQPPPPSGFASHSPHPQLPGRSTPALPSTSAGPSVRAAHSVVSGLEGGV